jgi:outer membrane receptor protein involved in Fe transport
MRTNPYLRNLLATTFICGAVGLAAPAYAQDSQAQPGAGSGPIEGQNPNDAPNASGDPAGDDDIVVTGSRIRQPNLTAVSPVTVLNSQEVTLTGTTRAEDLINSLPQAFASQGSTIANGSSGTATLNLRGLGEVRTLVLINGRRLVPGDPGSSAADINFIPSALIDRVDVLTGGASSVYGADAVAGVVNFIMDTDFEGVRLDTQYSFYQHENHARNSILAALNAPNRQFGYPTGNVADGGTFDANLAIGAGFDDGRGHVMLYAGYRKTNPVLQARRDYSSCNLGARSAAQIAIGPGTGANAGVTDFTCGGSATSANGTVFAYDDFDDLTDLTGAPGGGPDGIADSFTSVTLQIGPNRTLIPGFTPYNFGPLNHFMRPDERYTLGGFANYEISPALRPYLEVMFMDDRTVAQIAPSGDFGNTLFINCGAPGAPTVNAPGVGNPLLSAQQRSNLCDGENLLVSSDPARAFDVVGNSPGETAFTFIDPTTGLPYTRGFAQILRRNVEGGGRQDDLQHTSFRTVAGMRGDLSDIWSYDVYYQFARTNFAQTYSNDFSVTRLTRSLDVIDNPNTPGVDPVCRSVLDGTDPNCVPYDIFATGQVNPAALAYLQVPLLSRGIVQQQVASASMTGNLGQWGVQSPWATNGVGVAFGLEYRKDSLEFIPDVSFQTGDGAGQGAATLPVFGEYDVREAFAEIRIPIVEDNFFHLLAIEGGYRYSDYGLSGRSVSTDTYKLALDFAPVRDIRFRGAYNRAVRAPNVQELFAPQRVVLNGSTDPCSGFVITAADTGCIAQGLSIGQNVAPNPAAQYNGLVGGNTNLNPEIADTITLGVVFQPRFIPRLAITVDVFDIQIDGAIQGIGQDTILQICTDSADPFFCSLINRDGSGSLWRTGAGFVQDLSQNIGGISTRGIDVSASYSMELGGFGGLAFSFVGTWLDELISDSGIDPDGPTDGIINCAGFYGNQCGTPNPKWRHTARINWTHPDGYGISARWRHFGSVDVDDLSADPDLAGPNTQPGHATLGQQNYFDLTLTARIGDHYAFRLGVNNILDRDPPTTGSQNCPPGPCNGNTWSQVYDSLGRYIFAGVTLDF